VHEGAAFPDVRRAGVTLPTDGSTVTGTLDHTGYALFDVARTTAPKLQLTGSLPPGTAGAIMLVGRGGDEVRKTTDGVVPTGGRATVRLDDPGRYSRITAVVVNGSYDHAGWNGQDWKWTRDQQPVSLAATALSGGGTADPGTADPGTTDHGAGAPGGGGGGAAPGGDRPGGGSPATLLSIKAGPAPRLAKAKALTLTTKAGASGTFTATAGVDAATAKRLRLGTRATTIGTGRLALPSGGSGTLKVTLTGKARARLRAAKRPVAIAVRIVFEDAAGATTARRITVKLRR
jgi:hypothetical protein